MSVLQKPGGDHAARLRRRRQWTLPSPPALRLAPFEGASILDEVADPLRLALWTCLRDVLLWASITPARRGALFTEQLSGAHPDHVAFPNGAPSELATPLRVLTESLFGAADADPTAIARACLAVTEWAGGQGYLQTASHFAEAAAAVRPRDPGAAFFAGRAARWQAAYERAEQWFDRSIALARRAKDYSAYIDARLGRGNLHVQQADLEAARTQFMLAWRTARKHKIRTLGAAAQHNLLALAYEEHRYEDATEHSKFALKLYGSKHPRFPYIAHDTAQLWVARGFFAPALAVFNAVRGFITAPAERVQLMANIGRAAAGTGDTAYFYEAWEEVMDHARHETQYVAASYVNLAEGARALRKPQQAVELAERAVELARRRGERVEERRALAVLEQVRGGQQPEPTPDLPVSIEELSRDLVAALDQLASKLPSVWSPTNNQWPEPNMPPPASPVAPLARESDKVSPPLL